MQIQVPKSLSAQDLSNWLSQESDKPLLVDVRESDELAIAPFPFPVVHLPLSQAAIWTKSLSRLLPKHQPVVVICHAGVRSWNFANWLMEQDFEYEVWNLDGGIDAWSVKVDPTIQRY